MIIFKRLLAAAIIGAVGLLGGGTIFENPTIAIIIGIIGVITGWNIPKTVSEKIVTSTEESLSGPKRNPLVTIILWLIMFAILALGLIALGNKYG